VKDLNWTSYYAARKPWVLAIYRSRRRIPPPVPVKVVQGRFATGRLYRPPVYTEAGVLGSAFNTDKLRYYDMWLVRKPWKQGGMYLVDKLSSELGYEMVSYTRLM